MKAIIAVAAAAAAIAAAAPAAAQSWGREYAAPYGDTYGNAYGRQNLFGFQSDQLARRIAVGVRSGALSQWEARDLDARLRRVVDMERRFARDGRITAQEHRELGWSYADLNARIRVERADREDRYDRYGRNDDGYGYSYRR